MIIRLRKRKREKQQTKKKSTAFSVIAAFCGLWLFKATKKGLKKEMECSSTSNEQKRNEKEKHMACMELYAMKISQKKKQ